MDFQVFVKISFQSRRIERPKRVRKTRWGISNANGTNRGKLMTVGKRTVNTGIVRIKFDVWCLNSDNTSFVLNITTIEMRKKNHSTIMLVKLVTSMFKPYISLDIGHSNCVPPVR
jgi:hypothetical protein